MAKFLINMQLLRKHRGILTAGTDNCEAQANSYFRLQRGRSIHSGANITALMITHMCKRFSFQAPRSFRYALHAAYLAFKSDIRVCLTSARVLKLYGSSIMGGPSYTIVLSSFFAYNQSQTQGAFASSIQNQGISLRYVTVHMRKR